MGQLRATVFCFDCEAELTTVEAGSARELGVLLASTVLCAHSTTAHRKHQVTVEQEGEAPSAPGTVRSLKIECLAGDEAVWETACPLELVPALALVFHTGHEGHRMRLTYDGRAWSTP